MILATPNIIPSANSASAATSNAPGAGASARDAAPAGDLFDDVMGNALASRARESAAATSSQTPVEKADAPPKPEEVTNDEADKASEQKALIATLTATTVPAQVVLALAAGATAAAPQSPSDVAGETQVSEANPKSADGSAVSGASTATKAMAQDLAAAGAAAGAAATAQSLIEAIQEHSATSGFVATSAIATRGVTETARPVSEKITTGTDSTSIKIPMGAGGTTSTATKSTAVKTVSILADPSQSAAGQTVVDAAAAVEQTTTPASTPSGTAAGTHRAKEEPMQTLRDVWSNSAFRTLAYGGDTGKGSVSSGAVAPIFTSTETVRASSVQAFAAAVENALNTPRELLPRRVEILVQTPPGAIVTLSLTRANGELRAQFDANNAQTLQWLNGEVNRLQSMNFGITVRWAPPQMSQQQQEEYSQRPNPNRQEDRRREGGRRQQQTSMDALIGVSSPVPAPDYQKG